MLTNLTTKTYIATTEAIRRFKQDHKGVTAIEYGLIAVAMAAFIVIAFSSDDGFIGALKTKFGELKGKVAGTDVTGG
ncbi:Flp family type IVb pilin [Basfia succiniciproducens]|uniref:Pilus assembly protein Flp/PilA n=1 Tax=Basfia succiniciproducens TaxID=653940 RepID=A0A1G5EHU3_9PAST|nr:Flp family type IVb pilin [Basfia succiniciproducens]QIM69014.1 fimbrial protein [Basfia succiniciproducens]SCY26351.1 pilus assembly protein Flp/PilA [Basfia succiniciproducens]